MVLAWACLENSFKCFPTSIGSHAQGLGFSLLVSSLPRHTFPTSTRLSAPALYENPVPLSMAKMIMSRHVCLSFSLGNVFP